MTKQILSMSMLFVILVLLQVLVCNHIMLFNLATPFIFIYFILRLPVGMSRPLLFTLAFVMGFLVDLFSDTPGVNALATTLLAAVKQPVFYAYVQRDDKTKLITPSMAEIGWQNYSKFALTMCMIFCFLEFSIEFLTFAGIEEILLMTLCSSLLTLSLIIAIDSLLNANKSIMA